MTCLELLTIPTDNKETLNIGTKGYYNSIGIQCHRKQIELLPEWKMTFKPIYPID